jgi:uncharacterized protein (DUF433 family)
MMISTPHRHVQLDTQNVPWIAGTTMKVVELVVSQQAYGWSPEEMHWQYPHLTMGQIHSALAYYWDFKDEMDADIQRRFELAEDLRRQGTPLILSSSVA